MSGLYALVILTFVILLHIGSIVSVTCPVCDAVTNLPPCRKLRNSGCEHVIRPCSCCITCARNLGEPCSSRTPKCATGLMCVNGRGEALEEVPWVMDKYQGQCQNVVVQPVVVENTDVDDRRFGSVYDDSRV